VIRYTAPGKNPASAIPKQMRQMTKPVKFFTMPVKVMTMPQETTRMPMYVDGRLNFFKRMLHGTVKYYIVSLALGIDLDGVRVGCTFKKNVGDEEQR
jgi:hypothetical protein